MDNIINFILKNQITKENWTEIAEILTNHDTLIR